MWNNFTLLMVSCVVGACLADIVCPMSKSVEWMNDPQDCKGFYMCFNGRSFRYACPDNLVWDHVSRACQEKSHFLIDPCMKTVEERKPCVGQMLRDIHTESCAKYFECQTTRGSLYATPFQRECPYPLLFDSIKERCEFPESVGCNGRMEPTDPCEYAAKQCQGSNCEPCHMANPSCKNMENGLNAWKGKEWTTWFAVCNRQRVVFSGQCSANKDGRPQLFDPENRTCREIIQFPDNSNRVTNER